MIFSARVDLDRLHSINEPYPSHVDRDVLQKEKKVNVGGHMGTYFCGL